MNLSINLEYETQVLGAVLTDSKVMDEITFLEDRDFHLETHQLIWKSVKWLWDKDKPIDIITVMEILERGKKLDLIGGISYLTQLANSCLSIHATKRHAETLKKKAVRRRAVEAGQEISRIAEEYADDDEMYQSIEELALSIRPGTNSSMKTLSELRDNFFTFLNTQDDLILTGFKKFDEWMGGLGRGWLYILAGRPSAGKTAKALQMAYGIAKNRSGEVLIWSQEMTYNQVLARMLSPISNVNGNRIRRKTLEPDEICKLDQAYDELEKLPFHINDSSGVTIEEIRSTARQIKRQKGKIGAIIVDYLGIMKIMPRNGETRAQAIGNVTRTAKAIAKELECPFILLAQMNREGAKQEEPDLSSLKESGDIEQDADIVEFVFEAEEKNHNGKVVISKIAKGRDVGVSKFKYLFKGWLQKYEEMD